MREKIYRYEGFIEAEPPEDRQLEEVAQTLAEFGFDLTRELANAHIDLYEDSFELDLGNNTKVGGDIKVRKVA